MTELQITGPRQVASQPSGSQLLARSRDSWGLQYESELCPLVSIEWSRTASQDYLDQNIAWYFTPASFAALTLTPPTPSLRPWIPRNHTPEFGRPKDEPHSKIAKSQQEIRLKILMLEKLGLRASMILRGLHR